MSKISFEKIIKSDVAKTFKILTDFENFEKLLPEFYSSIAVKSIRDESSLVAEHLHLLGNEFVIMAKHFSEPPNKHQMRVVGGDIKGSSISEIFSFVNGKTLLKVNAELDVKSSRFSKKNPYGDSLTDLYDKMILEIEKP